MDRLFMAYDKECMRMAILKHEQIFKQQVYELHHLYRIQKILMKSLESTNRAQETIRNKNKPSEGNGYGNGNGSVVKHRSKSIKLDMKRPVEDYITESNGDGSTVDESEIELTLGVGPDCGPRSSFSSSSTGSTNINRRTPYESATVQVQVEEEDRLKQKHHPPWLFQVLI